MRHSSVLHERGWFQQAIRDSDDLVDVAYISLFAVMLVTVGTVPFLCGLALLDWLACSLECHFALRELGEAVALVCGGFSTALVALSAYMAATRKPKVETAKP